MSAGIFKLGQVANPKRQHAIRIFTVENRHLRVEQRFFCDKPTEKTVTLNVSKAKSLTEIVVTMHAIN